MLVLQDGHASVPGVFFTKALFTAMLTAAHNEDDRENILTFYEYRDVD